MVDLKGEGAAEAIEKSALEAAKAQVSACIGSSIMNSATVPSKAHEFVKGLIDNAADKTNVPTVHRNSTKNAASAIGGHR